MSFGKGIDLLGCIPYRNYLTKDAPFLESFWITLLFSSFLIDGINNLEDNEENISIMFSLQLLECLGKHIFQ